MVKFKIYYIINEFTRNLINKQRGILTKKQHEFEKNITLIAQQITILMRREKFIANDEKIFFTGSYEVIGTVNEKTCYWRWAWSIQPYLYGNKLCKEYD